MNAKQPRIQIMSLMTLTVVLCALPPMSLAGTEWTYLTDMPTPRVALSTSVVEGKIYTIGGRTNPRTGKSSVSTVEEYDPASDQWTTKASMMSNRYDFATCVVDGKIYAMGGFTGAGQTATVERYDPVTDTWTRRADLPTKRASLYAGVVDGKIYMLGAGGGSRVEAYDPVADTWTTVADMPTPRYPRVSIVNGKIYAIGGPGVGPRYPALSLVEEYDPATDTWTRKADMPTPRHSFSTAVIDGRIYAVGGRSSDGVEHPSLSPVLDVEAYDPATDTWTKGPPMTGTRNEASACAVDGALYVFGGWRVFSTHAFSTVEALDLNPMVDFNFDGAVDFDDLLILVASWGLDDPLVDIGPMPWGDGVVDASDLLVLAAHMAEYDNLVNDLLARSTRQPLAKKPDKPGGGNGKSDGTSTGWNHLATISGGSWDGVTAKQIWAVDGAANLGGGTIQIRDSSVYETTSLGIGADVIYRDGQATGAGPVIDGYQVTGLTIFPKTDEVTGNVYELELLFIAPETGSKQALHATVSVEPGVIPGEYPVTLIPDGPFNVRLDYWQKGKRVDGPVVDTGYSMGAIEYTPLEAP